ncbi:ATP-dependent helicase HrpB [Sphingomonas ginkgonis]|uniref:RNA helicase n=1 Tax=Sphingomonas ginkgonis TaxID=2315330 RepID=A0A429VBN7_9SPHN|nr:ATP-dependent helicase HrpB [Sphingomonas ginkgonis]RST31423.1 ATP-dependent helicase HrpB [Sphingomonas ginkgonis]
MTASLPIHAVLPDLLSALRSGTRALLIAPPGAGKTTAAAPALLNEPWCTGQILLLVPRRLAARAAAEHMARQRGEQPGGTIGYQTRLDSKASRATRIIVMTHGVFLSRIQADPELEGVSAVLFDEVHERSLDSDLALALTLDAAAALREELRVVAMSATLDGERFGRLLGNPPRIESEGKSFPLTVEHAGRDPVARIEAQVASACRRALLDHPGSLLAFLPGVAEIERTADLLRDLPAGTVLHKLHGGVEPAAQRAALARPNEDQRKLVLSTSIAETSVTLEDVQIVVDSGLARRPRYDRGAGLTRLVTERASQASVTQRAGRAARQAPGVAIRLWEEAATSALPAHEPPEILEADLSGMVLVTLLWGEAEPQRLPFLDPPPAPALAEARQRLTSLGAIDEDGRLTSHGRAIAALPLEPRLAHMLIEAGRRGFANAAADTAVLLTERGLGGNEPDLDLRHRRWRGDRSPRADAARGLARRWARLVAQSEPEQGSGTRLEDGLAASLALAFPDRLSRRRDASGEHWQSVGGRGFQLDPASPLARSEWLAVAAVAGRAAGARILAAAPITQDEVLALFASTVEIRHEADFDPASGAVVPTHSRRLGSIRLSAGPDPKPDAALVEQALLEGVRRHGVGLLPWSEGAIAVRARAEFARNIDESIPALDDEYLLARLDDWLPPLLDGRRRLGDVAPGALRSALDDLLGFEAGRNLARLAPADFASPAGTRHPIDYAAPGGPTVEVRAQALFGLDRHPMVGGGRVPLTLAITSPAGRPIQTSRDLPGFWAGSWREVAKEMRGRYPRHNWPDDPAAATASLKTKRAQARS